MNKKEVLEIRKQFKPDNNAIMRICGCYVDGDKDIKLTFREAFGSLTEEEAFKYYEIFRKTLSGTLGKNLMNMEFPLEQEYEGGTQEFLLKLKNSRLEDEEILNAFYQRVIDHYIYGENYYIILIYGVYDIPGKATDGSEMFDASDNVYDFVLCSICPVNLSKAGLYYNVEKNSIEDRIRDWVVDLPSKGFLFPAFNDRNMDIHGVLYYSKNPEELQQDFVDQVLGCVVPLSATGQKETFQALLEENLGEECDYETVRSIHENLNEIIECNKENPDPVPLAKWDVRHILEESGVADEKIEEITRQYDEVIEQETPLLAANVADTRSFSIKTPDVVIKVNPERTDLIETRIIDGKQCLIIVVDDHIEVNGMNVRTIRREGEQLSDVEDRTEEESAEDVAVRDETEEDEISEMDLTKTESENLC